MSAKILAPSYANQHLEIICNLSPLDIKSSNRYQAFYVLQNSNSKNMP